MNKRKREKEREKSGGEGQKFVATKIDLDITKGHKKKAKKKN